MCPIKPSVVTRESKQPSKKCISNIAPKGVLITGLTGVGNRLIMF